MDDQVNEIQALHCLCIIGGRNIDSLEVIQTQLARLMPDTKVISVRAIASASIPGTQISASTSYAILGLAT